MGTDCVIAIEAFDETSRKWVLIMSTYACRCYSMFALLNNIRGSGDRYTIDNRGIPDDISADARCVVNPQEVVNGSWVPVKYGHTWYTYDEMKRRIRHGKVKEDDFRMTWDVLLDDESGIKKDIISHVAKDHKVRLILAFDN